MTRLAPALRPLLWAALAIVVAFLYDPGGTPLQGDDPGQFYIAERAASGVPPHASSINAKNGLGFLMPAAAIRVGRVLGLPDVYAVRVYGILLLAVSVALVWLVASGIGGRDAADIAALALLAMPAYVAAAAVGVQPKLPLVSFLLLTGFALTRGQWILAGGAAAAAFLCWQPMILAFAAAAMALILERQRYRDLVRLAAGGLVVIAVYEAYFLARGLLFEQLSQAYVFPARFMSTHRHGPMESLVQIARNFAIGFQFAALTAPIAALWAVQYLRSFHRPRLPRQTSVAASAISYWQLGVVAFALFTIWENQGSPDLFVFIPFLAVGTGVILGDVAPRLEVFRRLPWLRMATVALFALAILAAPVWRPKPVDRITLADQAALARELDRLATNDEGIFVANATHLLALEQRDNWTRYGHFFRGMSEYLAYRYGPSFDPLRRDGRLPEYVLLSRPKWIPSRLTAELESRFELLEMPKFERQGVKIYRLRGTGDLDARSSWPGRSWSSANARYRVLTLSY